MGNLTQKIKSYPISHDAEINTITGTKYIHYGDIHTGKLKRITNEKILPNINDNNYIPLKSGDVIVADASEDYKGIADACVIDLMKEHYKIVSGLHTIVFRPNEKLKSDFLYTYFHTPIFKHYGYRVGTGLKVFGITYNNLSNMEIKLPKIDEQNKVDKIINIVTNIITLQQRKVKLLELFRKAIHNNIFPEYGKETPVIRHKKFANKWNVVKFNTIYKKSTEKNDLTYGEDKIISVAKMYFKQEKNKSSQDYLKTYNVFKIGDIAFEGNRSEGFSHGRFVQNTIGNGIVSHVFDVFTPIKKDNLKYWKYAIHNEHVMKYVLVKSTTKATMMNNLSSKNFLKQSIAVPSSEEMNTIAKILQDLDNQINITNNKINYLQNMKKFLLKNMFI